MGTKTKSFDSSMSGAPVLSGTAGALIAVLDACLVNGFGLQTASALVVASGVATATLPSTPAPRVGSVILVAGATPSGLNGEQRVTAVVGNTVSFATALGDQSASGTITVKLAAAGWTKPFSGTNLAAYKIPSVLGTACYLRLDDTGTTTARAVGYESMSGISAGTGPFPTAAQFASGLWVSKSSAASVAARAWRVVADDRGVFLFVRNADTASEYQAYYFGDILSLKTNDPYACVLRANSADRSASVVAGTDDLPFSDYNYLGSGLYIARAANTLGGAQPMYQSSALLFPGSAGASSGAVGSAYPSPVDNGLMLARVSVLNASGIRGYYPGVYMTPQIVNAAFATGDVIPGSGDMVGRSVTAIKTGAPTAGTTQGVVFMDTLSDWR